VNPRHVLAPFREAVIDLGAVRHNVRHLAETVTPARIMAVVKADAYGHGAVAVARAALDGGAEWLGVADLDEAIALRGAA
jgi:alanine racemase